MLICIALESAFISSSPAHLQSLAMLSMYFLYVAAEMRSLSSLDSELKNAASFDMGSLAALLAERRSSPSAPAPTTIQGMKSCG